MATVDRSTTTLRAEPAAWTPSQTQLEAWRLVRHDRPKILPALVAGVAEICPGFGERPMSLEDVLATCAAAGIALHVRPVAPFDGYLTRWPAPVVSLRAGLAERFRIFAAFHELAHYVGHPRRQEEYLALSRRGGFDHHRRVELEASTIGLLAIEPLAPGLPPRRIQRLRINGLGGAAAHDRWAFDVREPEQLGGRLVWRARRIVLRRFALDGARA